ncbi:MAG: T9SS type A sorting domain-containing protein [Saprospiraceae bacterium]|nr:T9SS type A sorting domain-containing protein [Saprospiraceae bacterium]
MLNLVEVGKSQSGPYINGKFTWEGAFTGNKAIWNADDTLNVYKDVNGVDLKVTLKDPFKMNTTTKNLSEFNDFTKTNTFFGWGNFALQIKSNAPKQPVCLEFEFSKPIYLNKFNIWDIDMLQAGTNLASTYQDSIHVFASNNSGAVPLKIAKLDSMPTYTIVGQQIKANFIEGVDGDVSHNNPKAAILITCTTPIQKFTICHSNGSEDDGLSNSHAIKIPEFEYAELVGLIEGVVFEDITNIPLTGSLVSLIDEQGNPVYNKLGNLMETMTGKDGSYYFPYLPVGKYTVVQIDPPGYESVRDIDIVNDNNISVELGVSNIVSKNNDFFEKLAAPLPVSLTEISLYKVREDTYRLSWKVDSEINNDFYTIFLSEDGIRFKTLGFVKGLNKNGNGYIFDFKEINKSRFYVKLSQTDFDGRSQDLGIREISNEKSDEIIIFPNPVHDIVKIHWNDESESFSHYSITDINGKTAKNNVINNNISPLSIDLRDVVSGTYALTLYKPNGISKSYTIIKQ